jgi:hypothetical protein
MEEGREKAFRAVGGVLSDLGGNDLTKTCAAQTHMYRA